MDPQDFTIEVQHPTLLTLKLTMKPTDTFTELFQRVQDNYQMSTLQITYNGTRLANSNRPLSNALPCAPGSTVYVQLTSTQANDALTLKYMCEKCGHTWWRELPKHTSAGAILSADGIRCPKDNCNHGIILKCRKENVQTTYDAR